MSEQNHIPNGQPPVPHRPPVPQQPPVMQQPPRQPMQYHPPYQGQPAMPPHGIQPMPYQPQPVQMPYVPVTPAPVPPQMQQPAAPSMPPQMQRPVQAQQPPLQQVVYVPVQPVMQTPPAAAPRATAPARTYHPARRRDVVFAVLLVILSVLAADFFLFGGLGIGGSICACLIYLSSVVYLWKDKRKFTPYAGFCAFGYLSLAISLSFSDDEEIKVIALGTMILLWALTLLEMMQLRARRPGTFGAVRDVFYTTFVMSFGRIGDGFYGLFHGRDETGKVRRRRTGSVMIGIGCAAPVLLIIVPLLMSSDAAFTGLLEVLAFDHLGEIFAAVVIGLLLFMLLFAQSFSARHITRKKGEEWKMKGIEPIIICSFLGILLVIYGLYMLSQLAYFFNAFARLLPEDYSVAEYARRGFFEMAAVCGINLVIVFLAEFLCRKKEGKPPISVRLLLAAVCGFCLVLIATAFAKMVMYIDRYGLTRMRILTSVFMVFLAVVFIAVLLRLFLRKIPHVKIALITAVLLLLVTSCADVDRIVAGYNVNAYLTGKHETVDMETLDALDSDGAVKYILRLCTDADPEVAGAAKNILWWNMLRDDLIEHGDDGEYVLSEERYDWRGYNVAEYEARSLLIENWELIKTGEDYYW